MTSTRPKRRCKGRTLAGARCRAAPLRDGDHCLAHDERRRAERGFGGPQDGSGRPRQPRPTEALRERIEADIDAWLAPLEEAREAVRVFTVGTGENARSGTMPDHATRLRAVGEAFDRAYGKPRQTAEVSIDDRGSARREVEHNLLLMQDEDFREAQATLRRKVDEARRAGHDLGSLNGEG